MRYVTTFERLSKQEGLEQGLETGEASMLWRLLQRRFELLPAWVEQRLDLGSRGQRRA